MTPSFFSDRLLDAIRRKKSPVVAGVDPHFDKLPAEFRRAASNHARAKSVRDFSKCFIKAVAPHVPAVKIQVAFFECFGPEGMAAYEETARFAKKQSLIVIGDVKRADIGSTSEAYAAAHLGKNSPFDAITVNPYFGWDGVEPFAKTARENGKGIFVLVRNSNPSAASIQGLLSANRTVAEHVAKLVSDWGKPFLGKCGMSDIGAVVAANFPKDAARIRKLMPKTIFLVPGYGAQGGTAETARACFLPNGTGAILNASRSLLFACKSSPWKEKFGERRWEEASAEAAKALGKELQAVCRPS